MQMHPCTCQGVILCWTKSHSSRRGDFENGGIAEIKNEKAGIVVVDVSRKVKYRPDR